MTVIQKNSFFTSFFEKKKNFFVKPIAKSEKM